MHHRWKDIEELIAKEIGGVVRPGSGNKRWAKGDIISERWLMEVKTSLEGSLRVLLEWIETVKVHAANENRCWALAVAIDIKYTDDYWIITSEENYARQVGIPIKSHGRLTKSFKFDWLETTTLLQAFGDRYVCIPRDEFDPGGGDEN